MPRESQQLKGLDIIRIPRRRIPKSCRCVKWRTAYWKSIDERTRKAQKHLNGIGVAAKRHVSDHKKWEAVDYLVHESPLSGMFRYIGISKYELGYDLFRQKIWNYFASRGIRSLGRFIYKIYASKAHEVLVADFPGMRVLDLFKRFGRGSSRATDSFFEVIEGKEIEIQDMCELEADPDRPEKFDAIATAELYSNLTTKELMSPIWRCKPIKCMVLRARVKYQAKLEGSEKEASELQLHEYQGRNYEDVRKEIATCAPLFAYATSISAEDCKSIFFSTQRQIRRLRKEILAKQRDQYKRLLEGAPLRNPSTLEEEPLASSGQFYSNKLECIKATQPEFYTSEEKQSEALRDAWKAIKEYNTDELYRYEVLIRDVHALFPGETPWKALKSDSLLYSSQPMSKRETHLKITKMLDIASDILLLRRSDGVKNIKTHRKMHDITTTSGVQESSLPVEMMNLIHRLADIHGPVKITRESSGIHANIADPDLLEEDGQKEFDYNARHLAINLEKYLGLGSWAVVGRSKSKFNTYSDEMDRKSAMCMKTGKTYRVSDLLRMPPIEKRRLRVVGTVTRDIQGTSANKRLVSDENGNMVPESPGKVTPVNQLPDNHPAVWYLRSRGFDLDSLVKQFNCSYCYEELPESRAESRFYRRLGGGVKDTPQGRIILEVRMNGVRCGWQARLIDYTDHENGHYFIWHPYRNAWVCVKARMPDGSWKAYPEFADSGGEFKPSKYKNATGSERNKLLMGFDAAVEFNKDKPRKSCVIVEGPLDAGKIGPPAIAICGKFLSANQALSIEKVFKKILVVADNDSAGRDMLKGVKKALINSKVIPIDLPPRVKDAGELTLTQARSLVNTYL